MTRRWRIREEADRDVEDAVAWYEHQRAGLGDDLRQSVRDALMALREMPTLAASLPGKRRGSRLRRFLLQRFPYAIVILETEEEYAVIAVAHARRRPDYWSKRLKKPAP